MRSSPLFALYALMAALFALPFSIAQENTDQYGHFVANIEVPEGLALAGVQKSIVKAGFARRWAITTKVDGMVVLKIFHRGYDSTLTFLYNADEIKIYSDSWAISNKGRRKKQKDPTGWIANLEKDIAVFMSREVYF